VNALRILNALALMLWAAAPSAETVSLRHGAVQLGAKLEIVSEGGLADGVVVLLHGTLAHKDMEIITTVRDALAERGRNTLAVTLSLGVNAREGMYDCATPHAHRHQDAVAELGAWMQWLAARGTGPVVLVGHSRGGNQATRYALADAARLRALVLIAPATHDAERTGAAYRKRHGVPLAMVLDQARQMPSDAWLDDTGFLYCGPSRVTAGAFLSYYADDGLLDTPSLLPRVTVPTLIIAGSADQTVHDVPERSREHLDADTRLLVVDGADHFFRDLYAEDVADAIDALIVETSP